MLTERNRAVLHHKLSEVVGDEEAVSEMLSNFPNDERDPVARESFVRNEVGALRIEMHQLAVQLIMWTVGTSVALAAVILTAIGIWA